MIDMNQLINLNLEMLLRGEPLDKDDIGYNKADFYVMSKFINPDTMDTVDYVELARRFKKYTTRQFPEYKQPILDVLSHFKELGYITNKSQSGRASEETIIRFDYVDGKSVIYSKVLSKNNILKLSDITGVEVVNSYLTVVPNSELFTIVKFITALGGRVGSSIFRELTERGLLVDSSNRELHQAILIASRKQRECRKLENKDRKFTAHKKSLLHKDKIQFNVLKFNETHFQLVYPNLLNYDDEEKRVYVTSELNDIEAISKYFDEYYSNKASAKGFPVVRNEHIRELIDVIATNEELKSKVGLEVDCSRAIKSIKDVDLRFKILFEKDENDVFCTVTFAYNEAISATIKKLPRDDYKWNVYAHAWHIHYRQLNNFKKMVCHEHPYIALVGIDEVISYAKGLDNIELLDTDLTELLDSRIMVSIEEVNDSPFVELKFKYNEPFISLIRRMESKDRKWSGSSWLIKKSSLYILLQLAKANNLEGVVNLSYIEAYADSFQKMPTFIQLVNTDGIYTIKTNKKDDAVDTILAKYCDCSNMYAIEDKNILRCFKELSKVKNITIDDLFREVATSAKVKIATKNYKPISVDKLKRKPFSYQSDAVKFMLKKRKCILGDEMGLGKTFEAICAGASIPAKKLIICPASLKLNWRKEIHNTIDGANVYIISSGSDVLNCDGNDANTWVIINYELLDKCKYMLDSQQFGVLICDEAHFIKSVSSSGRADSKRANSVLHLAQSIPYKFAITGTPITNKAKDIWNLLKLVEHPLSAKSFWDFADKYCDAQDTPFGRRADGFSNLKDLNKQLKKCMIRRLKKDVLDLPDITRTFIPNTISLNKYNESLLDYISKIKQSDKPAVIEFDNFLAHINALRYILATEKIQTTISLAQNFVEEGESVVIFTNYTEPAEQIYSHFKDIAVKVTGSTSMKARDRAVEDFQSGKAKVFVGNTKAAGVGLTLTAARVAIFNDFDFVPANHLQPEERIHRIGQDRMCNIFYNYAENAPIDSFVTEKLEYKFKMISKAIDDVDADFVEDTGSDTSLYALLLEEYKKLL